MPKPYPREFREDVVRVARNRGSSVSLAQVARDFGIHEMTLQKWLRKADVDEGVKPRVTSDQARELRDLKRRNRLLEQRGRCRPGGCRGAAAGTFRTPCDLRRAGTG